MQTYWDRIADLAKELGEYWEKEDYREAFSACAKITATAYEAMKELWKKV